MRRGRKVVVSDDGPGLPPGSDTKIFEPFVTTKPAGLGMGLSIAPRLWKPMADDCGPSPLPRWRRLLLTLPLSDGGQSDEI